VRRKVENLHDRAFECSPFTFHSLSGYNSNKNRASSFNLSFSCSCTRV